MGTSIGVLGLSGERQGAHSSSQIRSVWLLDWLQLLIRRSSQGALQPPYASAAPGASVLTGCDPLLAKSLGAVRGAFSTQARTHLQDHGGDEMCCRCCTLLLQVGRPRDRSLFSAFRSQRDHLSHRCRPRERACQQCPNWLRRRSPLIELGWVRSCFVPPPHLRQHWSLPRRLTQQLSGNRRTARPAAPDRAQRPAAEGP